MAIDNAEERRAIAGVPFWPLSPGVTPNAAKDREWRMQVGWNYSSAALPPTMPGIEYTLEDAQLHFTVRANLLHYTPDGERLHFTPWTNRLHYTPEDNRLHFTLRDDES